MLRHLCFVTLWLAVCLMAQDEVAPTIPQLTKDGDALYLKGDYETARQTFARA